MGNSEISNDCVEGYQSIFTAQEDELLEVEHFFAEPKFSNVVDSVLSPDACSLQKGLNVANGDALASNFLEGERAKNGLLAGTLAQSTEGVADAVDGFPDICEDYLLDIVNDDTSITHMEKIDMHHHCDGGKEMASTTSGELNPLARIFRFRTKPRARNVKRGKPATYDYLKSFSEVSKLVFNLSDMREESSVIVTKKRLRKPKRHRDKSLEYNLRNRKPNYRSFAAVCGELQDDISEDVNGGIKTQKGKIGRRKRHTSWSIPEVLKLVEGVTQHGVGKWTEIKRLFFSTCAHRSSVDLKDKWRNLLRASCKSACIKGRGEWVRGSASPTVPHHILCRVRELSVIHPYPRQRQRKVKVPKTMSSASSMPADNVLPLSTTL